MKQQADIVLNVGRSRLTILSITLALFLFSTGVYINIAIEMQVRAVWAFLSFFVAICVGFGATLLSLLLFLLCQRLSREGECEIWSFSCGELLMYVALAQTLSGGLGTYVAAIGITLTDAAGLLQMSEVVTAEFVEASGSLMGWLQLLAGTIWAVFVYVSPTVFLLRNPLPWSQKRWLGVGYVVLLMTVFWISAYPYHLKATAAGRPSTLAAHFAKQFWQPATWQLEMPTQSRLPLTRDP